MTQHPDTSGSAPARFPRTPDDPSAPPPASLAAPRPGPAAPTATASRGSAAPAAPLPRRAPAVGGAGRRPARRQGKPRSARPGGRRPEWRRRGSGAGALVAADGVAALIGLCEVGPDGGPVLPAVLLAVLLAVLGKAGLYRPALAPSVLNEVPAVTLGVVVAWSMAAAALAATTRRDTLGWADLTGAVALTAAASVAGRALAYRLRLRRSRLDPAPTLVVGAAPAAQQVAAALRAHPEYGLHPVGVAAPGRGAVARQSAADHDAFPALPLLTGRADIAHAVVRNSVRHAVVVGPPSDTVVGLLTARGCQVWRVGATARPAHLWGHAYTPVSGGRDLRRHVKRAMDVALAAVALLAVTPAAGRLRGGRPLADGPGVLFRQQRTGLDGRPFTLLKFRTLRPSNEHESATRWNISQDHRMGAVGRLLRRSSLDELPQLWNVLRGDMSLVGPRPERPYFVDALRPGPTPSTRTATGCRSASPAWPRSTACAGDTSIDDRVRFDNHYIESWSLWQDVAILLRTAGYLFRPAAADDPAARPARPPRGALPGMASTRGARPSAARRRHRAAAGRPRRGGGRHHRRQGHPGRRCLAGPRPPAAVRLLRAGGGRDSRAACVLFSAVVGVAVAATVASIDPGASTDRLRALVQMFVLVPGRRGASPARPPGPAPRRSEPSCSPR